MLSGDKVSVVVPVPVAVVPSDRDPSTKAVVPAYHRYAIDPVLVLLVD